MSNKSVFDEIIARCARELFQEERAELRPTSEIESSIEHAATIGFSADEMRGVVGIGMNPATLQNLVEANLKGSAADFPEDWLGELVNQLLGRMKHELMRYGVILSPALPTVLRGVRLQFVARGSSSLWTYAFDLRAGSLCVWADVSMPSDLVLATKDDPELQGRPAGDLVLF